MEATGTDSDVVHVLRHNFRPNEPLYRALSNLIHREPTGSQSFSHTFSLYGSDERVVDISDIYRPSFTREKSEADKVAERHCNVALEFKSPIETRIVQNKSRGAIALQLIFELSNSNTYEPLRNALDVFTYGERRYAPGFYATRLYASVPYGDLKPLAEVKEAVGEIKRVAASDSSASFYQVIPSNRLAGEFVPRLSRERLRSPASVPSDI